MIKRILRVLGDDFKQPEQRIRVLMVAPSQCYLLREELFFNQHGRDLSIFSPTTKPKTALKRMLQHIQHDVHTTDFELIQPTNIGRRRTWFAVWFLQGESFDQSAIAHDHNFVPLMADFFPREERKLAVLKRLCADGVKQRAMKLHRADPATVATQ